MAGQQTSLESTSATQEEEWTVDLALGRFIREWTAYRGDPSHENYRKVKEDLSRIERLVDKEKP
jgi:hypothetical protein